jgi:hypothetical protein
VSNIRENEWGPEVSAEPPPDRDLLATDRRPLASTVEVLKLPVLER